MRGGSIIGVPLTLLQLGVGVPHLHLLDVANNVAVCHAIYDADRMTSPPWAEERLSTRLAALASTAYYASTPETAWMAPLVLLLHAGYTPLKPYLAPVKPFFVSAMWTLAIYYAPFLKSHAPLETLMPAALFLSLTSLSHAADVADLEEDARDGVLTPAVRMGRDEAKRYAVAVTLAAVVLHAWSPLPNLPEDALLLAATYGVLTDSVVVASAVAFGFAGVHVATHDVELLGAWLRATEGSHKFAIEFAVETVRRAAFLPSPYREAALDACFWLLDHGDRFGSTMLDVYENAVRDRLLTPPPPP